MRHRSSLASGRAALRVDECCYSDDALEMAALAEPLAVCVHAVRQASDLVGRRLLVTGCGPICALVILAARRAGALEIVATDLTDATLQFARKIGPTAPSTRPPIRMRWPPTRKAKAISTLLSRRPARRPRCGTASKPCDPEASSCSSALAAATCPFRCRW